MASTGSSVRDRPRVLQFLCTATRGGVEEHVLDLLTRLEKFGFSLYVAAPPALLHRFAPDLRATGVQTIAIDMSSPLDVRGVLRLGQIFVRERIDILHCHMVVASFSASPVARLSGVKVIIETCHGRESWREGKALKGSYWFDRQIGHLIDGHIAVSHAVADHLRNRKRIPAEKICVIRNGRDLSRFRPSTGDERAGTRANLGLLEGDTAILVLGRLSEEKGQHLALRAFAILAERWPRSILLFAGAGALEPALRETASRLDLSERVRFLGPRNDAPRLLGAADLVLLPSLTEGLPLVAIEALATARPIVATRVGGTPEVVIDGETGVLAAPEPNELAAAIERLLSAPELAARLTERGRAFVEEHFDVAPQVAQTASLYRELLACALANSGRPAAANRVADWNDKGVWP